MSFSKYASTNSDTSRGQDYSGDYSKRSNSQIFIGKLCSIDYEANKSPKMDVVMFKPFLKSFEIDCSAKGTKQQTAKQNPNAATIYEGVRMTYKLSIEVPAISRPDAKNNAKKISKLLAFLTPAPDVGTADYKQNTFFVSMGNLIQSGKYRARRSITNNRNLVKYGLHCEIYDFDVKVDTKMGFFEDTGAIWPKVYTISMTLHPQEGIEPNGNLFHIKGFTEEGGYATINNKAVDIRTWPFGVR